MQTLSGQAADQAGFLLGGIGTGNVTVGSRGELKDWELFNRPGKGNSLPYTFFCLRTETDGEVKTRVLESQFRPPFRHSHGISPERTGGLPRFQSAEMTAQYPFVRIALEDARLPVSVQMEGFTPFIPLNADESGIPAAVIRFKVRSSCEHVVHVSAAGSLANAVGFEGYNIWERLQVAEAGRNQFIQEEEAGGLFYTAPGLSPRHLNYGSMAIISLDEDIFCKEEWLNSGWWDGLQDFWDDFSNDGRLERVSAPPPQGNQDTIEEKLKVGSIGAAKSLKPGEEITFTFILAWYFPNRAATWQDCRAGCDCPPGIVKNHYATRFHDAWDVGKRLRQNLQWLEQKSRDFQEALYSTTVPESVIDAVANNITVIRSPTCFRIEDGTFMGWEGCFEQGGCCEGSCNHVWNYAQTLAFLFPQLERTMRKVEFALETDVTGNMPHRSIRLLDKDRELVYRPAVDGQLGTIIRLYRDWAYSGDDAFLKELWDRARLAMDYALDAWDEDGDRVLDGLQYVTYDIEFYGPNALTASLLLAALKAMARMAGALGQETLQRDYERMFEQSRRAADQLLWNGQYYQQKIEDVNIYKYQYGTGCLADQLFGQFLAHVSHLGYILPENKVKQAIFSVFRNNFLTAFDEHPNTQRAYALNDEKGLVLCTWPLGERPRFPFVYANEAWPGVEYQVAALLIYEGFVEEGLALVEAVQERYDGHRRNPWNEVECGNHYVRSMSSWALLPALSGFRFDGSHGQISFSPKLNQDSFQCFWITSQAWGVYRQELDAVSGKMQKTLEVLYGDEQAVHL